MIDQATLGEILAQYSKHGWILRRVLLSDSLGSRLAEAFATMQDVEIVSSTLDGLWFTRPSATGSTAWELRHLSTTPYALVVGITEGMTRSEAEELMAAAETKMLENVASRPA